jgi:adenosylcobinamide kinase/adenosylcobinamide-phosphate guanylyltransferase
MRRPRHRELLHMDSVRTVMLVLGGVRSGKSRYAQAQASRFARVTFVATAWRSDAEMRRKIAAHRRERPREWKTIEAHKNLDQVILREGASADLLLIDCLTTYCAGLLSRRGVSPAHRKHLASVIDAIATTPASVFLVSNEVGSGVVPAFKSGRLYRDVLGELNQQVARVAGEVVLLVAGVPVAIKRCL